MYCPLCGKNLDDDAVFCPYCGTKVSGSAPESPSAPKNDSDDFFSAPPPPVYDSRSYYSPQPSTPAKTNTLALVGFILSFFSALAGLICSLIGLKQCNQRGEGGRGLAIAGIVISSVSIALRFVLISSFGYYL